MNSNYDKGFTPYSRIADEQLSPGPSLADDIDPEERRHLRDSAVHSAVLMHDELNQDEFMHAENIETVLKTAQALYDWVINGG